MKEAIHIIDRETFRLPNSYDKSEIENFKSLAKKGMFHCPYCDARLHVKYGDERGLFFSHYQSESCEVAKKIDKAERRYQNQSKREAVSHRAFVGILLDELKILSKTRSNLHVEEGFKAKPDFEVLQCTHRVGHNF